ncbi:hypothetical protein [Streptomyces sp. NPDC001404]|uniref:hypothetical protein n=1 Tax=Streptomyces sp. NPDC001404 TaxID=3364571 RepID=UPI0036BE6E32
MPTTVRTAPGTCRTVMSLYLSTLDHTRPTDLTTAARTAHRMQRLLDRAPRPFADTYLADAIANLRTAPATHHARLAWARALANRLNDRP